MIAKLIEERIDTLENHITWSYIAKKLNLSKSTLSKFKNDGMELSFHYLLELSELLYPKNHINVMSNWCLRFKKPSNVKQALEFLSINRSLEILGDYIEQLEMLSNSSPIINELTDVYKYLLIHQKHPEEKSLLPILEEKSYKKPESNFLLIMCKLYQHHRRNEINDLLELIQDAKKTLVDVKDATMLHRYELRLSEIESALSLFVHCDTAKARVLSEKILKEKRYYCDKFVADSYYRIGMSYMYESPDMCLAYLQKSIERLKSSRLIANANSIENNEVNLVKIYWGLIREASEIKNKPSKAHFLAKNKRVEEAMRVISGLDEKSPFTRYYIGLANEDKDKLIESALTFKEKSNMFYANLPLLSLKKFEGMSEIVRLIKNRGK
jgi:transcriptional regulator with XRE-family HTH domain